MTLINLRRTLEAMPAGFDAAFAKVKELVADFQANEKFYLFFGYFGPGRRFPFRLPRTDNLN